MTWGAAIKWGAATWGAVMLLGSFALGCGADSEATAVSLDPTSFEDHECAACGMIVRDQPAPRGQLVHRDGTRVFFCAIGDLVTYAEAPSPHGNALAMHVEVMAADATPDDLSNTETSWQAVEQTGFVVGDFDRPVMGEPVLTFSSMEEARAAAQRLDARALTWDQLRAELIPAGGSHAH